MNLKKILVGAIFIVLYMFWTSHVLPLISEYLPFIPTGFTYWFGFIPIWIGIETIFLGLGVLLILFGLLV